MKIKNYMRGQCCVCGQTHNDLKTRVIGNFRVDVCWYSTADYDNCEEKADKVLRKNGKV